MDAETAAPSSSSMTSPQDDVLSLFPGSPVGRGELLLHQIGAGNIPGQYQEHALGGALGQYPSDDATHNRTGQCQDDSSSQASPRGSMPGSNPLVQRLRPAPEADTGEPTPKRSMPGVFDPRKAGPGNRYLFSAPSMVSDYCETHFRRVLTEDERKEMAISHPRPNTAAMFCPKADEAVTNWLGNRFPKQLDGRLMAVQTAMLAAAGPVSCLWSAVQAAEEEDSAGTSSLPMFLPTQEVLEVAQRSLVLLGNANAHLTQLRRQLILEAGDKGIARLSREDVPASGTYLFGQGFTDTLTGRVKASTALTDAARAMNRSRQSDRPKPPFRPAGSGNSRPRAPSNFSSRFPRPREGQHQRWGHGFNVHRRRPEFRQSSARGRGQTRANPLS